MAPDAPMPALTPEVVETAAFIPFPSIPKPEDDDREARLEVWCARREAVATYRREGERSDDG